MSYSGTSFCSAPLALLAREHHVGPRTLHRWLQAYRRHGLNGLAR
ncbi:MAG: helix-turn-helix domain-containing protein, partial [Chloroflexi bacterium]|nr:helix-turn-helix domain-containing protein [Chloroflexota bacterium]